MQRLLQPPDIASLRAKAGKDKCHDAQPFSLVHDGQNASSRSSLTRQAILPGG
ncbi:hypothetical protein AB1D50_004258 [Enterobacter hormaechei]